MTNTKAKDILNRSLKYIINSSQTMSKSFMMWPLHDTFPIYAESLDGCEMTSVDGEVFIDTMGGLGSNFLPGSVVKRAIKEQLDKGTNFSLPSALETELAELWIKIFYGMNMVKFCKNGSDATSVAIRAARHRTKKDYILMVKTGYHGWASDFSAVSERNYGIPIAYRQYVEKIDYNNLTQLEDKLKTGRFAAFIVEPVSLEEPNINYLEGVRELCAKYNAILIFDELITGMRFAAGGCAEKYNVWPDIITVGKAVGSGVSLAGVLFKDYLKDAFTDIFFSGTYFGTCLELASGVATAKYILEHKNKIYPYVWKKGNKFIRSFNSKCKELKIDAHTVGMAPRINLKFNGDDPVGKRDLYHIEMMKRGIFIGIQIYITPCHKPRHVDQIIQASNESLEVVAQAIMESSIDQRLGGQRSMTIFKRQ